MVPVHHYVSNFKISRTFKDVSNTLQNFTFMETTAFEIARGVRPYPPLVKGVNTKRLGKGRANPLFHNKHT